ncbi:hypothetical protein GCM10009712_37240 [Pseudarthrobacter sulfonivorans]
MGTLRSPLRNAITKEFRTPNLTRQHLSDSCDLPVSARPLTEYLRAERPVVSDPGRSPPVIAIDKDDPAITKLNRKGTKGTPR